MIVDLTPGHADGTLENWTLKPFNPELRMLKTLFVLLVDITHNNIKKLKQGFNFHVSFKQ